MGRAAGKKALLDQLVDQLLDQLMDELVVITGYHRKAVLRALNRRPISADGDDSSSAEPQWRRLSGKKSARGTPRGAATSLLRMERQGLRDWQVAVIESWSEAKD
jgi:hypothetical protein